jgi:uncharacterized protein YkwD
MQLVRRAGVTRLFLAGVAVLLLAACSTGGGGLLPGLTQQLDHPGASINRADALSTVNGYRASIGVGPLQEDASLDSLAQTLAARYAQSGQPPEKPGEALVVRYSAGYFTFAETFSSWRNSKPDAAALGDRRATRFGLGGTYNEHSPYGAYWVLVLGQ